MTLTRKLRLALLLSVLLCAVGCDQTSKHFARAELGPLGFVTLPGGFGELRLAENPGSFLSLGASLPEPWRLGLLTIGVGVGLLLLFAYLAGNARLNWICFLGLTLVWAGGTSNFIDRLTRKGLVTDFVFLRVGPLHTGVFNAADVLIMTGLAALAYDLWRRRHQRASEPSQDEMP